MGIEALQKQLTDGLITQEQYKAELKKLLEAGTITQEEHDTAEAFEGKKEEKSLTAESVQAMIAEAVKKAEQSAADKVRTEYTAKLKAEQEEKDKLLKEKMSEEERAKFEREKYERELADREAAINAREVELHTIDKLTESKLPLSFKAFLAAGTKDDVEKNIEAFAQAWQTEIKAAVDAKFKENSDEPTKRKAGPTVKTWSEMTLTERGKLYDTDPEAAIKLAAASGVKL